jgi:hypothetical protein
MKKEAVVNLMTSKDWEVVKLGTWLYADEIVCELRILRHGRYYGSGDHEDEENIREDREGEFYYIEYGSPTNPTEFKTRVGGYESLEEAMTAATLATHRAISWLTY